MQIVGFLTRWLNFQVSLEQCKKHSDKIQSTYQRLYLPGQILHIQERLVNLTLLGRAVEHEMADFLNNKAALIEIISNYTVYMSLKYVVKRDFKIDSSKNPDRQAVRETIG